jgi:predicted transcriptional regulator
MYDLYSQCLNGEQQPGSQALVKTLKSMITQLNTPTYIIIDAIDESSDRELLLSLLEEIHAWEIDDLHITTTSRPEKEIKDTLETLATRTVGLESALVEPDIRSYIRHTLEEDRRLRKWSAEVKDEVEVALIKGANGM